MPVARRYPRSRHGQHKGSRPALPRHITQRSRREPPLNIDDNVFGSVARGDSTSTSDIDLLVDFEPGRSLLDLTGLQLDLQSELGCKVDVISSRGLKPRMAAEIERDAVAL